MAQRDQGENFILKNKTFIELVADRCSIFKDKTAIHEGGRKVSFGKLWDLSGRVYKTLKNAGMKAEDLVMIRMDSV